MGVFAHDYPSEPSTLALAITLSILGIIAVALRFYTRRKQRAALRIDDWLTIPALIFTVGIGADIITGIALHSVGYSTPQSRKRENINLNNRNIRITSQVEWTTYLLSILALGCIKLSFLFFYKRCFCTGKRGWFDYVLYFMIAVVFGWMVSFFFAYLFACKGHFDAWWQSYHTLLTKCVDANNLLVGMSASDMTTDAIVLLLPLPMIWRLEMMVTKKLAVSGIFALGLMAVAASILKLAAVLSSLGKQAAEDPKRDEDRVITEVLWWIMLEVGLAMIACCLPTLRFLFKGISPESVIRSVRSVFSLQSFGSKKSHERIPENGYPGAGRNPSQNSDMPVFGANTQYSEAEVKADMERQQESVHDQIFPADRIAVHNTVDQYHSNMV